MKDTERNVVVEMSDYEWQLAATGAMTRWLESRAMGLSDWSSKALKATVWDKEIIGMMGEMAYAKYRNVWYIPHETSGKLKEPDIAGVQVRATHYPKGKLIVRDRDAPDEVYVLVICNLKSTNCRVVGWIKGIDAQRDNWRKDFGKGQQSVWAVPQSALQPFPKRK